MGSVGFSKDCKFKEAQIVLALITTTDGLPISYKVFPGNTHEVKTLMPALEELRKEFDIQTIEFAADRDVLRRKP
ncbi:MAG: transposase [Pseudomonadota bacterium]|nr:transposase [Pseudomonadota bacterium]